MRRITREEGTRWMALAKEYGFATDQGDFALGRFVVEHAAPDRTMTLRIITPIPADLFTESELARKTPSIMFERTATGEIVLSGRWWMTVFQKLSEAADAPPTVRSGAAALARATVADDTHLPADTDTIEIGAPDSTGELVPTEALPPGGTIRVRFRPVQ
jgi:hypothetical protein